MQKNCNQKAKLMQQHLCVHAASVDMEAVANIHTLHLTPKHNLS